MAGSGAVYKLQVLPHIDGLDNGPTASFAAGFFTGGEMHLADQGLKLRCGNFIPISRVDLIFGWQLCPR